MTTRALARKVRRLELLAKMHPRWRNQAGDAQQVVLPPVEEFRVLPLEEQKRLLLAWRPPSRHVDMPSLEEFKLLPVQDKIRLLHEGMGPPDPNFSACFRCLPSSEMVNMCRQAARGSGPGQRS